LRAQGQAAGEFEGKPARVVFKFRVLGVVAGRGEENEPAGSEAAYLKVEIPVVSRTIGTLLV
jgi:hypothetical protein